VARRALITGIAGQDGSLLAELLLAEGYEVVGSVRSLSGNLANLDAIRDRLELVELDLAGERAVAETLALHRPDEIYNLASVSLVPRSWQEPVRTALVGVVGVTVLLEAIRRGRRQEKAGHDRVDRLVLPRGGGDGLGPREARGGVAHHRAGGDERVRSTLARPSLPFDGDFNLLTSDQTLLQQKVAKRETAGGPIDQKDR